MATVAILALIFVLWTVFRGTRGPRVPAWTARLAPSVPLVYGCMFALVPLYVAQAAILVIQAHGENHGALAGLKALPLPVYDGRSQDPAIHARFAALAYLVGALETIALSIVALGVYRGLRLAASAVGWTVAVLAVVSLLTPALSTTDPYEYAAASLLGFAAYAPSPHAFDTTAYAEITNVVPMLGVIYGPLWLAFDTAVLAPFGGIAEKIEMLRVVNIALLVLTAWLLYRAATGYVALTALVLNPAIWYYVVLNPHADIDGIALVAGALLASRRARPFVTMLLVAAAGAIKAPFIVAGAAAFAPIEGMWRRVGLWVGAIALFWLSSLAIPRGAYAGDAKASLPRFFGEVGLPLVGTWLLFATLTLLASVLFLLKRPSFLGCAWFFGELAPLGSPWYLIWGLPYALASDSAAIFLVSLPLAGEVADPNF